MATGSNTETQLSILDESMQSIPVNMRIFTLCMRSLYAEQSVGSSSDTARKVTKLRDDTKKDAMVYLKGVLPISTTLVRAIRDFFEYYEELDLDEWKENLPDILEEVRGFKQCCIEVVKLHEDISVDLKKREGDAKVLVKELTQLTAEFERKKRELEESADTKRGWAVGLAFVPGVNLIATPILAASAESDLADAVAKGAQCQIFESVALVVERTMIPALAAFIDGLDACAGFFSVMENELTSFQNTGDKAIETKKKLHYTMVKKKAKSIGDNCQRFYAMIPGVRTDLLCIPDTGTDDNYVDKWLKKKQEQIKRKYGASITGPMRKMITDFSSGDKDKLLEG